MQCAETLKDHSVTRSKGTSHFFLTPWSSHFTRTGHLCCHSISVVRTINMVSEYKYLAVHMDDELNWSTNMDVRSRLRQSWDFLWKLKSLSARGYFSCSFGQWWQAPCFVLRSSEVEKTQTCLSPAGGIMGFSSRFAPVSHLVMTIDNSPCLRLLSKFLFS